MATVDTGELYQPLQQAAALSAGFLVANSFNLAQERRVVLGRPRTLLDAVAEFYGELDNRFDFFISTNSLSGDEIIELPRGFELVYYR